MGRRVRPGEKHRWRCDRCNTLWDKRDLKRDGEGMWVCPQEGPGRDGATLSRGNVEHLRSYVQRLKPAVERVGQYGVTTVEALPGPVPVPTVLSCLELESSDEDVMGGLRFITLEDGRLIALESASG